ncbi:hypothetical protein HAP47_0000350 [Bradyrhizobium sp. 41S5]|uniref:hypothetical protein n=1 Tax=Bradyrhizobium sp. 41S5 TaxID=1404443 RepID=UPI00156B4715|nr:hypothetical protein [Bradyrhizobium sp. 41S5]UFX45228.1 hypothetical protein HAP47_0000350 [Bradyrhizobium sp. 41S5]
MIDAALKARGVAAWQARARQLHVEANDAADYGDLKLSLELRRHAFAAEDAAREWAGYEVSQ